MDVYSECVVVCRPFDMLPRSPAPECNLALVGSHQARITVNNGSTATQPTVTSGLARGVVITPINTAVAQGPRQVFVTSARQTNATAPKLLTKAVCKSSSKKGAVKTFTLRDVNLSRVSTRDQLKQVIKTQLADDVIGDFDVGYYQASTVVSIRSPQDVMEIWNDVRKGVNVILWCDGLKGTVYATTGGSPYVYRNFMVCTQRMGDNEMRRPRVIGRAY